MTTVDIRGVSGRPVRPTDNAYGFDEALTTADAVRESTWQAALELAGIYIQYSTDGVTPRNSPSANDTHFRLASATSQPVNMSDRWTAWITLGAPLTDVAILDVIQEARSATDRGKVLGVSTTDENVLALLEAATGGLDETAVDARVQAAKGTATPVNTSTATAGTSDSWAPDDHDHGITSQSGGLDQAAVDARVRAGVSDWAETGNTDAFPLDKIDGAQQATQAEMRIRWSGSQAGLSAVHFNTGGDGRGNTRDGAIAPFPVAFNEFLGIWIATAEANVLDIEESGVSIIGTLFANLSDGEPLTVDGTAGTVWRTATAVSGALWEGRRFRASLMNVHFGDVIDARIRDDVVHWALDGDTTVIPTNKLPTTEGDGVADSVDLAVSEGDLTLTVGRSGTLSDLTDTVTLPATVGTGSTSVRTQVGTLASATLAGNSAHRIPLTEDIAAGNNYQVEILDDDTGMGNDLFMIPGESILAKTLLASAPTTLANSMIGGILVSRFNSTAFTNNNVSRWNLLRGTTNRELYLAHNGDNDGVGTATVAVWKYPRALQGVKGDKGDQGDAGPSTTLSDTAPGNTPGTASAGTSMEASRSDHDHGITPGTGGGTVTFGSGAGEVSEIAEGNNTDVWPFSKIETGQAQATAEIRYGWDTATALNAGNVLTSMTDVETEVQQAPEGADRLWVVVRVDAASSVQDILLDRVKQNTSSGYFNQTPDSLTFNSMTYQRWFTRDLLADEVIEVEDSIIEVRLATDNLDEHIDRRADAEITRRLTDDPVIESITLRDAELRTLNSAGTEVDLTWPATLVNPAPSDATPVQSGTSGSAGTSTDYSRADHRHQGDGGGGGSQRAFGSAAGEIAEWAEGNNSAFVPDNKIDSAITRDIELAAEQQQRENADTALTARIDALVAAPSGDDTLLDLVARTYPRDIQFTLGTRIPGGSDPGYNAGTHSLNAAGTFSETGIPTDIVAIYRVTESETVGGVQLQNRLVVGIDEEGGSRRYEGERIRWAGQIVQLTYFQRSLNNFNEYYSDVVTTLSTAGQSIAFNVEDVQAEARQVLPFPAWIWHHSIATTTEHISNADFTPTTASTTLAPTQHAVAEYVADNAGSGGGGGDAQVNAMHAISISDNTGSLTGAVANPANAFDGDSTTSVTLASSSGTLRGRLARTIYGGRVALDISPPTSITLSLQFWLDTTPRGTISTGAITVAGEYGFNAPLTTWNQVLITATAFTGGSATLREVRALDSNSALPGASTADLAAETTARTAADTALSTRIDGLVVSPGTDETLLDLVASTYPRDIQFTLGTRIPGGSDPGYNKGTHSLTAHGSFSETGIPADIVTLYRITESEVVNSVQLQNRLLVGIDEPAGSTRYQGERVRWGAQVVQLTYLQRAANNYNEYYSDVVTTLSTAGQTVAFNIEDVQAEARDVLPFPRWVWHHTVALTSEHISNDDFTTATASQVFAPTQHAVAEYVADNVGGVSGRVYGMGTQTTRFVADVTTLSGATLVGSGGSAFTRFLWNPTQIASYGSPSFVVDFLTSAEAEATDLDQVGAEVLPANHAFEIETAGTYHITVNARSSLSHSRLVAYLLQAASGTDLVMAVDRPYHTDTPLLIGLVPAAGRFRNSIYLEAKGVVVPSGGATFVVVLGTGVATRLDGYMAIEKVS